MYSQEHVKFEGRVERGEGMAARLGCPTANVMVEHGGTIPALGVYVGEAEYDGVVHPALVCINDGRTGYLLKMEVHMLDIEQADLLGKRMKVALHGKIRDLIPFPGEEEMARIIEKDLVIARQWFADRSTV